MGKFSVRRLSVEELMGKSLGEKKRVVFEHPSVEKNYDFVFLARKNRISTYKGRYPRTNLFLERNKDFIKVFADVGAANLAGAPTTVDAKRALGMGSNVYAVDREISAQDLSAQGITQVKHNIISKPLPFACDAIRLANVSQYMTREELEKTLENIWLSLKPRGFLLSAGPFGTDRQNPHNEQVLIKVRKTKRIPFGFVILAQHP